MELSLIHGRLTDMTLITAYYVAFGPHGPRALPPPGENWKVFGYTMVGIAVSFGLFAFARSMAKPPPSTMNKEYQEMTNEYLRVRALPTLHLPSVALSETIEPTISLSPSANNRTEPKGRTYFWCVC